MTRLQWGWKCAACRGLREALAGVGVVLAVLFGPGAGSALAAPAKPSASLFDAPDAAQPCNVRAVAKTLAQALAIEFPQGLDSGDVLDLVCAPHPDQPALTLVALFHDLRDDKGAVVSDRKGFAAAVIDLRRARVQGLYRDTLDVNPGIRITDTSLAIDTTRYQLAAGVRAFGVRMDIGHSPKCADGGSSDFLTLLVPDGPSLRAVLKRQPMHVWTVARWNLADSIDACSMEAVNEADLALAPGPGGRRGWRDLGVVVRVRSRVLTGPTPGPLPSRRKVLTTLHYDGERYPAKLGTLATRLLKP